MRTSRHLLTSLLLTCGLLACGDDADTQSAAQTADIFAEDASVSTDVTSPPDTPRSNEDITELPLDTSEDTNGAQDAEPGDSTSPEDVIAPSDSGLLADAEAPKDAVLTDTQDSQPNPDTAVPPVEDATSPPSSQSPSWWACRRALIADKLSDELKTTCDALHTSPPETRTYGIRWVFLTPVDDPEQWVEKRLKFLNTMYEPVGFSYITSEIAIVSEPTISVGVMDETFTVEALTSDIAKHMAFDETEPQAILDALKTVLANEGVSSKALDNLSLTSELKSQQFLQTMARARPDAIHVMIENKVNAANTAGGMSGPPGTNPISGRVTVVNIKASDKVSPQALPHELGHYFGLKHPHVEREEGQLEVALDVEALLKKKLPGNADMVEVLTDYFGDDLDMPMGEPYVPYNAKSEAMKTFQQTRLAIMHAGLIWRYLYTHSETGPKPVETLDQFMAFAVAGTPMYYKNLTGKLTASAPANNCSWSDLLSMVACTLGASQKEFAGDGVMLTDSITLNGGQLVNIMSYIGKLLKPTYEKPMAQFTPSQIEVMRLHANTPVRQLLYNHSL